MKKAITYGQLSRRLQDLGFTLRKVDYRGRPALVFIHEQDDTAMIALPAKGSRESVALDHLDMVRAILNSHGIAPANGEQLSL